MSAPLPVAPPSPVFPDDDPVASAGLPMVPGGWIVRDIVVAGRSIALFLPRRMERLFEGLEQSFLPVPYWAQLWPGAEVAAAAILSFAPWPAGSDVLELGSGVGLVGLSARLRGDHVRFSDSSEDSRCACERSALRNGWADTTAIHLDWRERTAVRAAVIVACDVVYDSSLHEPLLRTIDDVLEPGGVCWIADPGRTASPEFACRASDQFDVRLLDSAGDEALVPSRSRFQIFELRRPRRSSP